MQIELHEVEENKRYTVSVSKKGGSEKTYKPYNKLYMDLKQAILEEDET